jgi:hypothetical protein
MNIQIISIACIALFVCVVSSRIIDEQRNLGEFARDRAGDLGVESSGYLLYIYPYEGWLSWYWYFGAPLSPDTASPGAGASSAIYLGEIQTTKPSQSSPLSACNPQNATYYFFEGTELKKINMHSVYTSNSAHHVVSLSAMAGTLAATMW